MRRTTCFYLLVVSTLLLIQGVCTEYARQQCKLDVRQDRLTDWQDDGRVKFDSRLSLSQGLSRQRSQERQTREDRRVAASRGLSGNQRIRFDNEISRNMMEDAQRDSKRYFVRSKATRNVIENVASDYARNRVSMLDTTNVFTERSLPVRIRKVHFRESRIGFFRDINKRAPQFQPTLARRDAERYGNSEETLLKQRTYFREEDTRILRRGSRNREHRIANQRRDATRQIREKTFRNIEQEGSVLERSVDSERTRYSRVRDTRILEERRLSDNNERRTITARASNDIENIRRHRRTEIGTFHSTDIRRNTRYELSRGTETRQIEYRTEQDTVVRNNNRASSMNHDTSRDRNTRVNRRLINKTRQESERNVIRQVYSERAFAISRDKSNVGQNRLNMSFVRNAARTMQRYDNTRRNSVVSRAPRHARNTHMTRSIATNRTADRRDRSATSIGERQHRDTSRRLTKERTSVRNIRDSTRQNQRLSENIQNGRRSTNDEARNEITDRRITDRRIFENKHERVTGGYATRENNERMVDRMTMESIPKVARLSDETRIRVMDEKRVNRYLARSERSVMTNIDGKMAEARLNQAVRKASDINNKYAREHNSWCFMPSLKVSSIQFDDLSIGRALLVGFVGIMGRQIWQKQI